MDVSRGQGVTFYKWLSVGVDPIPDVDWGSLSSFPDATRQSCDILRYCRQLYIGAGLSPLSHTV